MTRTSACALALPNPPLHFPPLQPSRAISTAPPSLLRSPATRNSRRVRVRSAPGTTWPPCAPIAWAAAIAPSWARRACAKRLTTPSAFWRCRRTTCVPSCRPRTLEPMRWPCGTCSDNDRYVLIFISRFPSFFHFFLSSAGLFANADFLPTQHIRNDETTGTCNGHCARTSGFDVSNMLRWQKICVGKKSGTGFHTVSR